MSSTIICITSDDDAHLPFVEPYLTSDFVVVSPRNVSQGVELSFRFEKNKSTIVYDGKELTNVKSIWYRKPYIFQEYLNVPQDYKRYAQTALRNHASSLYSAFPDAFWLSDYYAVQRAGSKPRQLELAFSLGFKIPATLATSDKDAAAVFLATYDSVVVKKQATWLPVQKKGYLDFPTTKIKKGQEIALGGLHLAPAIFQQAIEADHELRVTVVGNEVFAASVRDKHDRSYPDTVRDWRVRYSDGKLKFRTHDLAPDLEQKCIRLVQELGLFYGAIDLIVDKQGIAWFLEINPNGQWAFIEDDTGLPIGKAVASLLERAGATTDARRVAWQLK